MAASDIGELSLSDYVSIFRAHRLIILAAVAATLAVAILLSAFATPLYRAEARVRVDATSTELVNDGTCLLYTSPSPRDQRGSRMPSSA